MLSRLRPHLTFANVVSLMALFVALGGTAVAAVIITDNSQVAQNTISGHKPPSGKHANIIAGSINGQDVFENSLGGRVIAEPTLTGNARKLLFSGGFAEFKKIATVGPYTFKVTCSSSPTQTGVDLSVNGPAGTADLLSIQRTDDSSPGSYEGIPGIRSSTRQIPANEDTFIYELAAGTDYDTGPGHFARSAGTVMLRSGSVLIQLDLHMGADASGQAPWSGLCILYGTATLAT
jgi:hypothetical protein